jgi:hypothetical protein
VVLDSPYRSLVEPLLEYVERLNVSSPGDYVTVVLPEFSGTFQGPLRSSTVSSV